MSPGSVRASRAGDDALVIANFFRPRIVLITREHFGGAPKCARQGA